MRTWQKCPPKAGSFSLVYGAWLIEKANWKIGPNESKERFSDSIISHLTRLMNF
jgi:hypothetical protein